MLGRRFAASLHQPRQPWRGHNAATGTFTWPWSVQRMIYSAIFTGAVLYLTVPKVGHIQGRPISASQAITGR